MNDDRYEKARKRVKKKKEFYQHLTNYLAMGVFFFVLTAITAFGNWWFHWPMLGWGIGIVFHYFDAFGMPGVGDLTDEWEEKAVQEELARMDRKKGRPAEEEPPEDELELRDLEREKEKRRNWDDSELV